MSDFITSKESIIEWAEENLDYIPKDVVVRRLQAQLTSFARTFLGRSKGTGFRTMLNRPTKMTASHTKDITEKSRRLYRDPITIKQGAFHYGNVFTFVREEASTTVLLFWTEEAVNIDSQVEESKIEAALCSKTVEFLSTSVFSEDLNPVQLSVASLRATIKRDKKDQRRMWVSFDGKKFYRAPSYEPDHPCLPMDAASDIVSFFQADGEILCATILGKLVLVGPQRAVVIE